MTNNYWCACCKQCADIVQMLTMENQLASFGCRHANSQIKQKFLVLKVHKAKWSGEWIRTSGSVLSEPKRQR